MIVTKKFNDLKIEDIPAKCKEKIIKSNLKLLNPSSLDNGGYKVHPTPTPNINWKNLINSMIRLKGMIQKENLFKRGKFKSFTIINMGIIQFPNPPINIGMTKKKIINKAWAVTIDK